jgi:hypothetical protein
VALLAIVGLVLVGGLHVCPAQPWSVNSKSAAWVPVIAIEVMLSVAVPLGRRFCRVSVPSIVPPEVGAEPTLNVAPELNVSSDCTPVPAGLCVGDGSVA